MNNMIKIGSICWLHFYNQAKVGHQHCGDYAYIKNYAPNHSKKIEDDELYVKVLVKDIFYINNHIRFCIDVINKDDTFGYSTTCDEPERLTQFDYSIGYSVKWSKKIKEPI